MSTSDDRPQIKNPSDAANLLMSEMGLLEQERMRVVLPQGCSILRLGLSF